MVVRRLAALAVMGSIVLASGTAEAASAGPWLLDDPANTRVAYAAAPPAGDSAGWHSKGAVLSAGGRYLYYRYSFGDGPGTVSASGSLFVLRDLTSGVDTVVDAVEGSAVDDAGGVLVATADRLVDGDTDDTRDVYRRDLTGAWTLVSATSSGQGAGAHSAEPAVSADGRYVAFTSTSRALVEGDTTTGTGVYLRDLADGTTTLVSRDGAGAPLADSSRAALSGDGSHVAFHSRVADEASPEARYAVRLRDLGDGATVTVSGDAEPRELVLDRAGRTLAFDDLTGIQPNAEGIRFSRTRVFDVGTGTSEPLRQEHGDEIARSEQVALSAEGRYVGYTHSYSERVYPYHDINYWYFADRADGLLLDRWTGVVSRLLPAPSGTGTKLDSVITALSPDARLVVFASKNGYEGPGHVGSQSGNVYLRRMPASFGAPMTTIGSGPASISNKTSATFAFSSPQAATSFACRRDTGAWTACTSPHTWTGLAQGAHTFAVRATDEMGRAEVNAVTRTFTTDRTAPQTSLASGPTATNDRTPTFRPASSESGSTFACRVDSGTWYPCTTTWTTRTLSAGAHTIAVRATDRAGNTDATPVTRKVTVDLTRPETRITGGPGTTTDRTPTFTYTSGDKTAVFQCRFDGGPFFPCARSGWTSKKLRPGTYAFNVRAVDPAGNVDRTQAGRSFTIR